MGAASSALLLQLFETCNSLSAITDQAEARDIAPMTNRQAEGGPIARGRMRRGNRGNIFDCLDGDEDEEHPSALLANEQRPHASSSSTAQRRPTKEELLARREMLLEDLFRLHDLNRNGVLEEMELIKLNEKIAMLHFGKDTDKTVVRDKYRNLFRTKLDPKGDPVPYETFREYMLETLMGLDSDTRAQELIMEQFIAEAQSARTCFRHPSFQSVTDELFLSKMPENDVLGSPLSRHIPVGA